jgi:GTPase
MNKFPPEPQKGDTEYKLQLIDIDTHKLEKLTTQMQWRLHEGKGFARYFLGLSDDGTPTGLNEMSMNESQDNLYKAVNNLPVKCNVTLLNVYNGFNGEIREYFIKQKDKYVEIQYDIDIRLSAETVIG